MIKIEINNWKLVERTLLYRGQIQQFTQYAVIILKRINMLKSLRAILKNTQTESIQIFDKSMSLTKEKS